MICQAIFCLPSDVDDMPIDTISNLCAEGKRSVAPKFATLEQALEYSAKTRDRWKEYVHGL